MTAALVVLAKAPIPGRVKTRLCPTYHPVEAAALAAAALADTLEAVVGVVGVRRLLCLSGALAQPPPVGITVLPQCAGGLPERIAGGFANAGTASPALLIGMDTPQLRSVDLLGGLEALALADAALGPAPDGGWWGLSLRRPRPALVLGVPTSRPDTAKRQRVRLLAAGLYVATLPTHHDVDTPADVVAVAARCPPGSRFAGLATSLGAAERLSGVDAVEVAS